MFSYGFVGHPIRFLPLGILAPWAPGVGVFFASDFPTQKASPKNLA
jgi:hypothetical protein